MKRFIRLQDLAALIVVLAAVLRCLVVIAPRIYFDQDPRFTPLIPDGLGPAGTQLLDLLTITAAGLVISKADRIHKIQLLLAGIGLAFIAWHAWQSAGNLRVGSSWAAAICTGLAAVHFTEDKYLRRISLAIVLGLTGLLAARGFYQILAENPRTIEYFQQHRADQLAAQGWSVRSAQARLLERRITQNEASGWFGLTNIYGSIMAAFFVGWSVLLISNLRNTGNQRRYFLLLVSAFCATVISLAGVYVSRSKGAAGAVVLALTLLTITWFLLRRNKTSRFVPLVGVCAAVVVLLAVVLRGLLGEHIPPEKELSLLFRWQYLIGAFRIWLSHPVTGVGPDRFKAAYQILKPALSPEEVISPHSIFADYISTLGLGGIALSALVLAWIIRCGKAALPKNNRIKLSEKPSADTCNAFLHRPYFLPLAILVTALIALRLEATVLLGDDISVRSVGIAMFIVFSLTAFRLLDFPDNEKDVSTAEQLILSGMVLVLFAHAQIEMTPVIPASAPVFMLVLGLAARDSRNHAENDTKTGRGTRLAVAVFFILLIAVSAAGFTTTARREFYLKRAAEILEPQAYLHLSLSDLSQRAAINEQQLREAQKKIREILQQHCPDAPPVSASDELFTRFAREKGLGELDLTLIPRAVKYLEKAAEIPPSYPEAGREITRLLMVQAEAAKQLGRHDDEYRLLHQTLASANHVLEKFPPNSANERIAAEVYLQAGKRLNKPSLIREGLFHAEKAADLDPYNINLALQVADMYYETGNHKEAAKWYRKTLELNELHRLDPLGQLKEDELARVRSRTE